ncbi:MAG: glycosyltransferase [Lachnospiraceae bacterium]|nr:glycosyltransferase [Lachnospiraceae bacterium]
MSEILLSIVIPHYNTPDSLVKLINSIPAGNEIEVIVVDDNSSVDLSECRQFIDKRENVHFYINDSGVKGAGASRNIALRHVQGEWILFADADDFFLDGFYDKVAPYLSTDYDMVYFAPTSIDVGTGEVSSRHIMYMELVEQYAKSPSLKHLMEMKYGFCTPWSKLIRASVLKKNDIQFDEIMVSNDIMCMTKCAFYSRKVAATDQIIYCVTRGGKTLTSTKNEECFDTRVDVLVQRYTFLRENLSNKEFSYAHIDRLALSRLVDVFIEHWGIVKFFSILKLYHRNGIRYFDIGLLNPVTLFSKAKIQISWWMDIKKHR